MNAFKKIVLAVLFTGSVSSLQAQKVAHLSLDSLMSSMPETKLAKDEIQKLVKGFESEVLVMQTELEAKNKDYLEKRETMSEPVKQNKEADLNQLQKRIEDFKMMAGQEIQKKQTELGAPILQKTKKGIEAVAKEGGYKYVLNTSINTNGALYSEPTDDIFAAVKKKLDSMPPANLPTTSAPPVKPPVKSGPAPKKGK